MAPNRSGPRLAVLLAVLLAPAALAYVPSMRGVFVLDDCEIHQNPNIRLERLSPQGLVRAARGWKVGNRPVAYLSFALNYYFGRLDPFGYHLVNLAIHLGCGLVLFFLFRTTLALARPGPGSGDRDLVALAGAALWLFHPLNIQAVTYVVQRMASLAALFYLAAMLCYVRGRLAGGRPGLALFLLAAVLGLLAVASKENAATLPLALFVYEWLFFRGGRREWLVRGLPWLAAGGLALAALALVYTGFHPVRYILSGYASRPFTPGERLLTEARVLFFYLSLFAWPAPSRFSLEHDFPLSRSLLDPPSTAAAVLLLAGAVVLALRWRGRRPVPAFAVLWFLLTHLVESSVIGLVLVFEHRNYLPLAFVCLALADAGAALLPRRARVPAAALLAALLAAFTFQRNLVWTDRVALLRDAAAKAPANSRVHVNLAQALIVAGDDPAEARAHCLAALRLDPREASALNDLGILAYRDGDITAALEYFRRAAAIEPRTVVFRMQLARTLLRLERYREAETQLRRVLALQPGNREAMAGLRYIAALRRRNGG